MLTDSEIHIPPNYTTMQPPAVGGSYVDPVFGTTITRLTDATGFASGGIVPEYSQTSSFNLDDSYLVLGHGNGGGFHLYDGAGNHIRWLRGVGAPRWSRSNPHWLYYYQGVELKRLDIITEQITILATLAPPWFTFGGGTGDVSDNERIVVLRDGRWASIWDLSSGVQVSSQELDTQLFGTTVDYVTITKDGDSFVVGFGSNGTTRGRGVEQFDVDGNFMVQVQTAAAHAAMGRDVGGTQVYFLLNGGSNPMQPAGCNNGLVKISLDGLATRTCLLSFPWSTGTHLSAQGNDGWVYVSTFNPNRQPVAIDPEDWQAGDDDLWHLYMNEIFRVRADGSTVERLAHTRSTVASYWVQPHGNISISGNKFVYGSDFQLNEQTGYADTYLIDTQQPGVSMSDLTNRQDALDTASPPIPWTMRPEMAPTGREFLDYQDASGDPVAELYDGTGDFQGQD